MIGRLDTATGWANLAAAAAIALDLAYYALSGPKGGTVNAFVLFAACGAGSATAAMLSGTRIRAFLLSAVTIALLGVALISAIAPLIAAVALPNGFAIARITRAVRVPSVVLALGALVGTAVDASLFVLPKIPLH